MRNKNICGNDKENICSFHKHPDYRDYLEERILRQEEEMQM